MDYQSSYILVDSFHIISRRCTRSHLPRKRHALLRLRRTTISVRSGLAGNVRITTFKS